MQYVEKEKKMKKEQWIDAMKFLGMGWYVATSILVGVFGGVFLDRWLNSAPWFTLIGLFVGLAVAVLGMYRMLQPLLRENKENKDNNDKKGGKKQIRL